MMQDRGGDRETLMPNIPEFHPQHPGGTCVFRGMGYGAEMQWGPGFSMNDGSVVEEYETEMMVPLYYDINPAKVITLLDMFRDVGFLFTCNGVEQRVRISGYECHEYMPYPEVFERMDLGTVFFGTFPIREDFDDLGDGIYRVWPPLKPKEILENHLVMFVGHSRNQWPPFLVFLNDCNHPSRLGRIYFSEVYQIPGLKHFSLISMDAGPRPAVPQAAAPPPPPLGPPQGPSRRLPPSGFQGRSPAFGPAQSHGTRQTSLSTRQGQVSGRSRCTSYYHKDAGPGSGSAQEKEMLDHLKCVLANEPVPVKSGQHIVEVKPQISTFLAGLVHYCLISRVLVVAPKALLNHWSKELSVVGLKYKTADYSGTSVKVCDSELQYAFKELRERIKPYFLCRMKSEVSADTVSADDTKLSKKNELIVWLKLTACQRKLYEAFLNSDIVHSSMQGSQLAAITIFKKICDHPMMLIKRATEDILEGMEGTDELLDNQDMGMVQNIAMNLADMAYDDEALQVEEEISCKLSFIKSLLRKLLEEGHHVLIFSQTCKMLNLIQEAILPEGYKLLRIDGTTKDREKIDFQQGSGAQIFLLTTRVGGLGLTLTKAARVIVVDPAWNPSTNNQAVDYAYRIGQTKDVIVYRLMTCGTIKEKIYKLQVFKGAFFRTATEQKEQTRFSKRDMQEMFSLPEQGFDVSLTQKQLQEEHRQQLVMEDPLMRENIEFLEQQGIAGVSNHSLLFTKTSVLPTLSEHDALDSKPPSMPMIARQYNKVSSSDYVANGAAHAFKPKDFTPRAYSAANSANSESPKEIKAKINCLSQTLANTTLVSKLPGRGEKLKKQIHALDEKLTVIESSPESAASRGARDDVICVDDQKYYDL